MNCDHLDPSGALLLAPDPHRPNKFECKACGTRFRPTRGEAWIHADEIPALGRAEDILAAADNLRGRVAVDPGELERLNRRAADAEADVSTMVRTLRETQEKLRAFEEKERAQQERRPSQ